MIAIYFRHHHSLPLICCGHTRHKTCSCFCLKLERPQRVASVKMSHSTRTSIDRLNEPFDLGSSLLYFPVVLPQSFYSKGGLGLEINFFCLTAPETQSVVINSYTTIYLVTFCISFHSHDEKPQLIPYHEPTSVSTHETRPIKAYHKVTGGGRFCSSNLVRPK